MDDDTYQEARIEAARRQTSVSGLVREALQALSARRGSHQTSGETSAVQPSTTFWMPLNLDQLARQQRVSPVTDLEEISNLWPADDDPDELLAHIMTGRKERRALDRGSGAAR